MRIYGESLLYRVHLKLRCGTKWEMKLCYHQGNVWLKNGWSRFADHYSILEDYMLAFRYKGNSRFRVVIFNASNTEIDYPPLIYSDHRHDEQINSVKDEPAEIFDDSETSLAPCSHPRKRARTSHRDDPRSDKEIRTKGMDEKVLQF